MRIIGRPKIGLALSGGGSRGLSHIGVIKVLETNKIPIDFIAGTSAGSIIGGLYAATKNIKQVESIVRSLSYKDLLKVFADPSFDSGLIDGKRGIQFIEERFGNLKVENTKIPFAAVATDVVTGKTVPIRKGNLASAIRASCSLPGFFKPFKHGKNFLIDGAATEHVPVPTLKKMGAEKVIAVNLSHRHFPPKDKNPDDDKIPLISVINSAMDIMIHQISEQNIKDADIVIKPDVPNIPVLDLIKGKKYIRSGEEACLKHIKEIRWMSLRRFLSIPIS